jgi:hypothetical protein
MLMILIAVIVAHLVARWLVPQLVGGPLAVSRCSNRSTTRALIPPWINR